MNLKYESSRLGHETTHPSLIAPHMKYSIEALESPPLLPHPGMNIIRSSEVMQDNKDLFASRDFVSSEPTSQSLTNCATEEPLTVTESPFISVDSMAEIFTDFDHVDRRPSPFLTLFSMIPSKPVLRKHYTYEDHAKDHLTSISRHDEMMARLFPSDSPGSLLSFRSLPVNGKRETQDSGRRTVHVSSLFEVGDERIIDVLKQYNSCAMSFPSGKLICIVMIILFIFFVTYPPEFSVLFVAAFFTPYTLLGQIPFTLTQMSPCFYIFQLFNRRNFNIVVRSYPVYYDYFSRITVPGATGFSLYWIGICAPLVEEIIKHFVPLGYLMPFLEFASYVSQGANPFLRLAPLLMHCLGLCLHPSLSLLLHVWWNFSSISLVTDDSFPLLQGLQAIIWSPLPMSLSHALGTLAPSDQYQWMAASMLSDAAICRLLGDRKIAEVAKHPGTPDAAVWAPYRFYGKLSNPGLSRGRQRVAHVECRKGPRGGGPSKLWEFHSETFPSDMLVHVDGYVKELDPEFHRTSLPFVEASKGPLNVSQRRVRTPRRSFGGIGPYDEPPSVSERRVAKHKVRTLLSAEEKNALRLNRCLSRDPRRLEHRDKALIDRVLASKYAGELLAAARPDIVVEGWGAEKAKEVLTGDRTIPFMMYSALMAALPPEISPLPYSIFLSVLTFLKAKDTVGALLSIELLFCSIRGAKMDKELEQELIQLLKLVSTIIALGAATDFGYTRTNRREVVPEGLGEFAQAFTRFSKSPLIVKLVAVVMAFIPVLAKAENMLFGNALLTTSLDWLASHVVNCSSSPLGILADFCTFIVARLELFSRTRNWADLFGSSPQIEWMDEADKISEELELARSRPGEFVPRVVCTKAKAHVAKALKYRESLVTTRAKSLASQSDKLEKALLSERKPPLGIIMTGPPGIGKTSLVNLVSTMYKRSRGIDQELNIVYSWSNDKYQSPNAVSCIINVNDAFQIKDEYSETGLDTYQSLVDSFALQVSGAAVDEKNVILTPDIVFVSTNASSYQFSRSSGGADKLDRRYMVVDFSWTQKCKDEAGKAGVPCTTYFQNHPKDKDLVSYHMGYMDNKDNGNTMEMKIKRELKPPCQTTKIEDVLVRIIKLEKDRPDLLKPSDILNFDQVCPCGFPCNSICGCWVNGIIRSGKLCSGLCSNPLCTCCEIAEPQPGATYILDLEEDDFIDDEIFREGDISCDVTFWMMAAAAFFAMASVLLSAKPPKITVQHRFSVPDKSAFLIAIPTLLVFLGLATQWMRATAEEGLIHSTPSVPPPPADEVVRVNLTTHAPYIGSTAASYQAGVEGSLFKMHAIVLNPDLLAVPKHFFSYKGKKVAQGESITITYKGKVSTWKADWPCIWLHPDRDVAFFTVGNLDGVAGAAFKLLPEKECTPAGLCNFGSNKGIAVNSHMEYYAESSPGDCGLAITDQTNTMVFGFHVGRRESIFGNTIKVGEPLSKELVRRCLKDFQKKDISIQIFSDDLPEAVAKQTIAEGVYPHGDAGWFQKETPLSHVDHIPLGHKTVYHKPKFSATKTTLFEEFGGECKEYGKPHDGRALKQPDGTWQSAETIRLRACDHANVNVDHDIMMKAVNAYVDQLPITEKDRCTPLSDYTAWCGSDDNVLINGVDVSKSHGASLQELGLKKDEIFKDLGGGAFEIHPVLLQMCEKFERELAGDGPLPMPYIRAVAKDEVYPSAKAALGRRRYFFLQDRACNHVMRKYLQPLITYLLEHPIESHIIGTVNAGSAQWKEIYKEITKFGRLVTDGDQNSMDTRHRILMKYYSVVLKKIAIKLGYDAHAQYMVERILASLSRYCLEMEGDFFLCFSGLVSGRADTLVCNSICLILIFYYAFFLLAPVDESRSIREVLALLVTGDDSAMNCHDSIKGWYNGKVVAKVAADLGYVMTAGNKLSEIDWVDISSIQYLKRGFREDGDYVWAPLATDSIFKALSYATGVKDPSKMAERDRAASHSAVREGFLHGKEFMASLTTRLLKYFPDELYPSYDELKSDYDAGIFEAWVNTHTKTGSYVRGDHRDLVNEGSPKDRDVVYPTGDGACPECPISVRGALVDFPVPTNSTMHRDIPVVLSTLPSELNPTSNEVSVLTGSDSQIQKFPDPASEISVYNRYDNRPLPPPMEGLRDILRVPRLISSPALSVFGTQRSIDPFTQLKSVSQAFRQALSPFSAIRADIGIRVKYTGSSALIGAQRIVFAPVATGIDVDQYNVNANTAWGTNRTYDIIQTSSLPHFDLDISCTMDKTILLPFIGHTDKIINQVSSSEWWHIESVPLNVIRAVNGLTPPEVKYEVWAWLENVEVDILIPEGEMAAGPLSRGLSYAAFIAGVAGRYVSTFEKIASYGAQAAQKLGLARATEPVDMVVLSRPRSNGHYMSGEPDHSVILGSTPFMLRDVSAVVGGEDETVTSISRKWCEIVAEATSATTYYAHPELFIASYPYMRPTNLGWLSMMFDNWTGDLEIKLQVLSSPLLRGRIGVNIYPPGSTPAATFRTDGSVLAFEFDVEGSTEFHFTVPYLYRKPVMTFPMNSPTAVNSGTSFRFYFLSDFVGPSATVVYPSVNIWMRAGEDFAFLTPNLNEAQGFTFVPEGRKSNAVARSGEFVDNLKELATRKSPMCTTAFSTYQLPADGTFPNTAWEVTPANTFNPIWTFDTYIRQAFWGYTGGTRYTVEPSTNLLGTPMYVGTSLAIPWSTYVAPLDFMTRGFITHTTPSNTSCDVVVPDRSFTPYKFSTPDLIGIGQHVECLTVTASAEVGGVSTIWSSAGEDRTFFLYKGPPRMRWPV